MGIIKITLFLLSVFFSKVLSSICTLSSSGQDPNFIYTDDLNSNYTSMELFFQDLQNRDSSIILQLSGKSFQILESINIFINIEITSQNGLNYTPQIIFSGLGQLLIVSSVSFSIQTMTFEQISSSFSIFSFSNSPSIVFQDCHFVGSIYSPIVIANTLDTLLFINTTFLLTQQNSTISPIILITTSNISNFTFSNSNFKDSVLIDVFFILSLDSNNLFSSFHVTNNTISKTSTVSDFFITFANSLSIKDSIISNNDFSFPFVGNQNSSNLLQISSCFFQNNSNFDTYQNALLIFQNFQTISFESNIFTFNFLIKNFIVFSTVSNLFLTNNSFEENTSEFVIWIDNCLLILNINIFSCNRNNYNFFFFKKSNILDLGSCLQISNSPLVLINSSKISNSFGKRNIPGIIISNPSFPSQITITYSLFLNNTLQTPDTVNSFGCALYITNYPSLILSRCFFSFNYVLVITQIVGGPVLYVTNPQDSLVAMNECVITNCYSYVKSLVVEIDGYNLSLVNSQFLECSQHTYTFYDFYTQSVIDGTAADVRMINCSIINSSASGGVYFLNEREYLTMLFNRVNIIYNVGYYSAGFNNEFETNNKDIILSESIFENNRIVEMGGGAFVYCMTYSAIIKFNFTVVNTSISLNYADPTSLGFFVYWAYSNNISYFMINCQIHSNYFPSARNEPDFASFFGIEEYVLIASINCSFRNNTSGDTVLFYFHNLVILNNVTFESNYFLGKERFLGIEKSIVSINNSLFIHNQGTHYFVASFGPCNISIANTLFQYNNVTNIFLYGKDNIQFIIDNITMKSNLMNRQFVPFTKLHNINSLSISNFRISDNLGPFSSLIENLNSQSLITNLFISFKKLNQSLSFRFFSIVSCSIIANKIVISSYNEIDRDAIFNIQQSSISLEDFEINLYGKTNSFYIMSLFQTDFNLSNSTISNLFFDSPSYFLKAIQGTIIFDSVYLINMEKIIYLVSAQGQILSSQFKNISTLSTNPLINIEACSFFHIFSSIFQDFKSPQSSILYNGVSENISLIIDSSFIDHNAGFSNGGVFYFLTSKVMINNSAFTGNVANRGGAIYFDCALVDSDSCNFSLFSNNFLSNKAYIDGGAYKYMYIEPFTIGNSFLNNSGVYGPDFSGYYCKIGFRVLNSLGIVVFSSFEANHSGFYLFPNVSSTTAINFGLKLFALDKYNQIIQEKIDSQIFVDVLKESDFKGQNPLSSLVQNLTANDSFYCENIDDVQYVGSVSQVQESDFSFTFNDFRLIACPTSLVYLKFYSSVSDQYPAEIYRNQNSFNEVKNQSYFILFPIKIDDCPLGDFYNPSIIGCTTCPPGYYSNVEKTLGCKACLPFTVCNGGANFSLLPTYWSDVKQNENIYQCNMYADNCLGGVISRCAPGYEGVLCGNCIRFFQGSIQYLDFLGQCRQCPMVFVVILQIFVFYMFCIYCLKKTLEIYEKQGPEAQDRKFSVKMMITFIHLMFFTKYEFDNVDFISDDFQNLIKNTKFFYKVEYFYTPFDCLHFAVQGESKDNPYIDIYFQLCMFYVSVVCYVVFLKIKKSTKTTIINRLILVFYIFLPIFINVMANYVSFRDVNGQVVLRNNTKFTWTDLSYEIGLFIIPNIFVFLVILLCQNIILPFRYRKVRKLTIFSYHTHEIVTMGVMNNVLFETLNLLTLILFFVMNTIEFDNHTKNLLVFMIFFYRVLIEFVFVTFSKTMFLRTNYFIKLGFFFDHLILLFVSSKINLEITFPFTVIEMLWFVAFILWLVYCSIPKDSALMFFMIRVKNFVEAKLSIIKKVLKIQKKMNKDSKVGAKIKKINR